MEVNKPAALAKGDTIAIVAPASPIDDESKIENGTRYFETLGYRVLVGRHATSATGYLAGRDDDRVSDLHEMFKRKDVRAIVSLRGGYGSSRLLSLIDYRLIRRNPKILVGFSDITSLQLAIWKHARLVTFHGPMLGSDFASVIDAQTEEWFWAQVTSRKRLPGITLPTDVVALAPGIASGAVMGGNLSLIVNLVGTRHCPDFANTLLCIEEVGEEPYRIDRMLVQLRESRLLNRVNGILGGQFTDCVPKDSKPSSTVSELLSEVARIVDVPVLVNLPFGHVKRKMTLPFGIIASVDAKRKILTFKEAAVV